MSTEIDIKWVHDPMGYQFLRESYAYTVGPAQKIKPRPDGVVVGWAICERRPGTGRYTRRVWWHCHDDFDRLKGWRANWYPYEAVDPGSIRINVPSRQMLGPKVFDAAGKARALSMIRAQPCDLKPESR